jgi:hypothetical protein
MALMSESMCIDPNEFKSEYIYELKIIKLGGKIVLIQCGLVERAQNFEKNGKSQFYLSAY